jgi:hypothetical protein
LFTEGWPKALALETGFYTFGSNFAAWAATREAVRFDV